MSDLDEAGRAMIALAGDAHDPTDADRARVRAALAGRLGAAAGLGFGTVAVLGATATATAAAGAGGVASAGAAGAAVTAAGVGSTLAMKLVGVAVAITTVVGVGATVKIARRSAQAPAAATISEVHGGRTVVAAAPPKLPAPAREQATSKALSSVTPADDPAPGQEAPNREAANHAAPSHLVPDHVAPSRAVPSHAAPDHAAPSQAALATTPTFSPAAAPTLAPAAAPTLAPEAQGPAKIDARDVTETVPQRRSVTPASASDHACPPAFSGANPAARRSESGVADEARLVHDGVRALKAGLPACALSLLDTHARHYPEGVLAEEREAERALALADLGRLPEARMAATAFLRKHPASPLGMRLRHRIPGLGE